MKIFTRTLLILLQSATLMLTTLSGVRAGNTPPAPPPTNVRAIPGNGRVTLFWDATLNAANYNAYWSTSPGVTTASPNWKQVGGQGQITGLTNGTRYYFILTSITGNTNVESGPSAEVSAVPQAGIVQLPPTGIRAAAGTSDVTVYWDLSPTAESYNLYYRPSAPGVTKANGTKIAAWNGNQGFFTQGGLTQGICYYFVVTAVNEVNESAESLEVCATPYQP